MLWSVRDAAVNVYLPNIQPNLLQVSTELALSLLQILYLCSAVCLCL